MRVDLEFANTEINRLRTKFTIDEEDLPSLALIFSRDKSELTFDSSDRMNSEFQSIKDAITTTTSNQTSGNSRNNMASRGGSVQGRSALSQSFTTGPVPKLDFKKLKHV
jgi:hypothetical protein